MRSEKSIDSLLDVRAKVESISFDNHKSLGKWSASQIFFHLAAAIEASMEGLPHGYPAVVRKVVRPFRWIVTRLRFPPWLPIPHAIRFKLEPPEDSQFEVQKSRLLNAIQKFEAFNNSVHPPHPVLGLLSRDEWIGFHIRHCKHHLSFVQMKP
jgi:hypothetical protein